MGVFLRTGSKFYWYHFCIDGRRYRGSTKVSLKSQAWKVMAQKLVEAQSGTALLPGRTPTLKGFSQRFLDAIEDSQLSAKTKVYYRTGWRLLSENPIINRRLHQICSDTVSGLKFPGSASNANCALRTLRRMLHKAVNWNLIRDVPKIKLAAEHGRSIMLDAHCEHALLRVASQPLSDIIVLMRDTGMRNERELYCLRVESIDWRTRMIVVPTSKTHAGVRFIPMSERVSKILARRCGHRKAGWVFRSCRSHSGHLTTLGSRFRSARKAAGLPANLVLYCGRHDYGTRILSATGNLAAVMETMGHRSFQSAMKYQHPDLEVVRAALNATK
jgi:integrase